MSDGNEIMGGGSWSMMSGQGLYSKYDNRTMTGGQDHTVLDVETQGLTTLTVRVDKYYVAEQRRETRHRQSIWRGVQQLENHNIEPGEWVLAINKNNRRTNTDPTARPMVISSLSGAKLDDLAVPDVTDKAGIKSYTRRFLRKVTVLGQATSQVITDITSRMNNEDQGLVVQIAGIFNGYSPLTPMPLGALVGIRAPTPDEANPESANWNPRRGTHRNKVVLIPEPVDARTVSHMAHDAIISVVSSAASLGRIDSLKERDEDMEVRIAAAAVENAIMNGLLMVDTLIDAGQIQIAAGVAPDKQTLLTQLGVGMRVATADPGAPMPILDVVRAAFVRKAFVDRTQVQRTQNLIGFADGQPHPGLRDDVRTGQRRIETTPLGQLVVRQLEWPTLISAIFEQQLDVCRNVVGRVTQAGRTHFKYVK